MQLSTHATTSDWPEKLTKAVPSKLHFMDFNHARENLHAGGRWKIPPQLHLAGVGVEGKILPSLLILA